MKDEVLLDLYFYTIQFCIDNKFSKEQISAFFSIIKRTHGVCVETPFGNVDQAFKYFRDMILCHAVKVNTPCSSRQALTDQSVTEASV